LIRLAHIWPRNEVIIAFTNFALPLLEGKTDAWKAACAEINGAKKELYLASHRNLGITKEIAALQQTPHEDYVVVHLEAADANGILGKMLEAADEFYQWFKEAVLRDCHGIDVSGPVPPSPDILLNVL